MILPTARVRKGTVRFHGVYQMAWIEGLEFALIFPFHRLSKLSFELENALVHATRSISNLLYNQIMQKEKRKNAFIAAI